MQPKAFHGAQKILVPVDGSSNSNIALDYALSMAKALDSKLFVLTVVDLFPETVTPLLEEKLRAEATVFLESARQKATVENVSCETDLHVGGRPFEVIVGKAQDIGADLVVMGAQGRSGLGWLLMGSVTERVIGHASCPVLVVPTKQ